MRVVTILFWSHPCLFILITIYLSFQIYDIYLTRDKYSSKYWKSGFDPEGDKDSYEWWMERLLVDESNKTYKKGSASFVKISDESINDICSCNTVKGELLHLFFIFFQTEPLGK